MAKITITIEDIKGGAAAQVTYTREPAGRLTQMDGAADIAGLAALGLLYSEVDTSVGVHAGDNEQLELDFGDDDDDCHCGCGRCGVLPEDLKL